MKVLRRQFQIFVVYVKILSGVSNLTFNFYVVLAKKSINLKRVPISFIGGKT